MKIAWPSWLSLCPRMIDRELHILFILRVDLQVVLGARFDMSADHVLPDFR